MDNTADVKAIMARFNAGGTSMEATTGGRPKVAAHPTLSSGPPVQKKPVLESSLSGGASTSITTPKPNFVKSTVSTCSAPEVRETPRISKPLLSKFENSQELTNLQLTLAKLPVKPKPPDTAKGSDSKPPIPKVPLQKPCLSASMPKPTTLASKPPWVKETAMVEDSMSSITPVPPKLPCNPKPKSSITVMKQQPPEEAEGPPVRPFPGSNMKPPALRVTQSGPSKERVDIHAADGQREGGKGAGTNDLGASKPLAPQKPSFIRKEARSVRQRMNGDASDPQRKKLPNIFALGSAPAKPNRPPMVNLERFKNNAESGDDGPSLKKATPPLPPASHPSNHAAPGLTSAPLPPSLPPRPSGAIIQPDPDENYDDVGVMNKSPPLPPGGPPGQRHEGSESDEEMYEDLDRWQEAKEIDKKQEKKRLEQEKRDQRERDKKEQDARKKFKLSGPVQVVHKVKARVDCKGCKTDLTLKSGETIEVIRISDNPEGRWLGRTLDGSYGYVKTESVEIDFDELRNQGLSQPVQMDHDPEVYDDVEDFKRSHGVILPPPLEGDGELYDDLDDPNLMVSSSASEPRSLPKPHAIRRILKGWDDWRKSPVNNNEVPPPPQFTPEGIAVLDKSAAITEELYDDLDTPAAPLPPPPIRSKPKTDDRKMLKKFEKEEKEFRKKFKFDGEILLLYQVTIISTLNNKKWGGKDLPLTPGETLDVISKPEYNKLICRNEEGKFGYVSTSYIVAEDTDIYDDIGDDCIYDND